MVTLFEQYYTLREKRLKLQREADVLEQQEKDILYEITKGFGDNEQVDGIEPPYRMKAVNKTVPVVNDWPAVLDYIRVTGEVDLLQKRLTESAVKVRWDAGATVPGVTKGHKWSVTIVKE